MHLIWKHTVSKPTENNSIVNLDVVCSDEISKHRKHNITSFKDGEDMTDPNPLPQCATLFLTLW